MALQLAKLAGLRVVCVADLVRHGSRLNQLGADLLVDRQDSSRAVQIIRSVTKGELRFAIDFVGKETAGFLQDSLKQQDSLRSHLVGLTGLPKVVATGVKHHNVPIKVFHDTPAIGETVMSWLEKLLIGNLLAPPDVNIAEGGLEGINDALDQLREGNASGKRIVVPLRNGKASRPDHAASEDKGEGQMKIGSIAYAEKLNEDPSRIKFA